MKKAMVVLSGGQDSTTCLFWAKRNFDEIHAVSFNYGQRHQRELEAADKVAQLANVASHEIVPLGAGILASTSPLVSDQPLEQYQNFEEMDKIIGSRVELTFVPMRNALFLTLAANRAVVKGCDTLVTGVCEADNANYPDCRAVFVAAMNVMIHTALGHSGLTVVAPLLTLDKAASIKLMRSLGRSAFAALAFTHTSYAGEYPPTDKNHANVLRAEGFARSGLPDPLVLRAWEEGEMTLPTAPNYDIKDAEMSITIADVLQAVGQLKKVMESSVHQRALIQ